MASRQFSRLCRSVLPPGFEQIQRLQPEIQQFLEDNLPESVCQSVTLLKINDEEIVIAANSPVVANYLRLHSREIQQQLRETFQLQQSLRFRSVPDSLLKLQAIPEQAIPEKVSQQSIEALERNAEWIEDEDLRAAILSLADAMKD